MVDWEILQISDGKGGMKNSPNKQIDLVGNIYQIHGAVQPIACQKCKKLFDNKVTQKPLKQTIMSYKCDDCEFENKSGDIAFVHLQANDQHRIAQLSDDKVVSIEKQHTGRIARIKKIENDVIILCDDCNGS